MVTERGADRLAAALPAGHGDYLGDDPALLARTAPILTAFLDAAE